MNAHAFFLAVGWTSALLLFVEILMLWRRSRRLLGTPLSPSDEERSP
ncbi:hypothetical protein [Roseateles chitosanitabidus]|jgi:hypothetical protein|nr:hypothetical protein [Roseateles chitosanitabidus]MBO9689518.1 hypothetical protein [Roseateles chitosanitabidus]